MFLKSQYWSRKPEEYLGQTLDVDTKLRGYEEMDEEFEEEIADDSEVLDAAIRAGEDGRTKRAALGTTMMARARWRRSVRPAWDSLRLFRRALRLPRRGRYEQLSDQHLHAIMLAFERTRLSAVFDLPNVVGSARGLLDLAVEYFFPGSSVAARIKMFEEQIRRRVVVEGHGCYRTEVPDIVVPAGKSVHFYCDHNDPLIQDYSNISGALSVPGTVLVPFEIRRAGDRVPNYFLGYPGGLTTDASGKGGLDALIVNRHPVRWIPLSRIFEDPKARGNCDIHWSACRTRDTDGKVKPGPVLELDVVKLKGTARVDNGHQVLPLAPVC